MRERSKVSPRVSDSSLWSAARLAAPDHLANLIANFTGRNPVKGEGLASGRAPLDPLWSVFYWPHSRAISGLQSRPPPRVCPWPSPPPRGPLCPIPAVGPVLGLSDAPLSRPSQSRRRMLDANLTTDATGFSEKFDLSRNLFFCLCLALFFSSFFSSLAHSVSLSASNHFSLFLSIFLLCSLLPFLSTSSTHCCLFSFTV